jgi:signal transduction histidine kinase
MNKIYDPFFRASNTKNYEGYGIGLPLARNIVRMHHGELMCSHENQGTTVQMRFPNFYSMQKDKTKGKYCMLTLAFLFYFYIFCINSLTIF